MHNKNILIIGGGLGGLFTGAFLAKEGYRVTVLEKNSTIGGGLQCFRRGEVLFETGMHILGGFREGGNVYKMCKYLGIIDKLSIIDTDKDCMDSVTFVGNGKEYRLPSGKEPLTKYLQSCFPHEEKGISMYMDALYNLSQEVDLFYLRKGDDSVFFHSNEFLMPADEFIASFIGDPELRALLAYMSPMYGGIAGHTPAYIHALINVLYINGSSMFVDGSQQLADCLVDIIESGGGIVKAGDPVVRVEVEDRYINEVRTEKGNTYKADMYISAIHPCSLLNVMPDNAFPKSFRSRISIIPNSYSNFGLYITLKDGKIPYVNHPQYFVKDTDIWHISTYKEDTFPLGCQCFCPPASNQGKWANRMLVNIPMHFDVVKQWENTKVGHRGKNYEIWKERHVNKVISFLDTVIPGFSDGIDHVYASSPLTIRDYYNVKEGSIYGFLHDSKNIALSQVPIGTKVKNLLFTGQNVNLHGICGVPLTALQTAEALIGQNKLIERINQL